MKYTLLIVIAICLFSCGKEKDINPFLVSKQNIGLLNDSTQVKDLDRIYVNDSIVKRKAGDEFIGNINDIEVFEKGGKHLLTLTASQALDSTARIRIIRVLDPRFKTEKGISLESTFKDIEDNYTISSIDKTFRSLIVSVDEINAFFNISKDDLPADMWFNTDNEVDPIQVPDNTRLNTFFVQWPEK